MRWHRHQPKISLAILFGGLGLTTFASCSQSSAPPPPSPTNSAEAEETAGTKKAEKSGSTSKDDELGGADGEVTSGTAFNYGGANIGDEDDKANVTKCHGDGKVYDRFGDEGGACSSLPLAKLDCTKAGIKAVLSDSQKKSFNDKLSGSFAGWELDQCGDCPEDSDEKLCKSTTGGKQTGTKIFFVMEEGDVPKAKPWFYRCALTARKAPLAAAWDRAPARDPGPERGRGLAQARATAARMIHSH